MAYAQQLTQGHLYTQVSTLNVAECYGQPLLESPQLTCCRWRSSSTASPSSSGRLGCPSALVWRYTCENSMGGNYSLPTFILFYTCSISSLLFCHLCNKKVPAAACQLWTFWKRLAVAFGYIECIDLIVYMSLCKLFCIC